MIAFLKLAFGSILRSVVRKSSLNDELNTLISKEHLAHGSGSVMMWGSISSAGTGMICAGKFWTYLMEGSTHLTLWGRFAFQQDNDPKATHKSTESGLIC